jgi:hypothetical protein
MRRVIRLTESDLTRIVRRVIMEDQNSQRGSRRNINEGATIDQTAKNLYDAYGGLLGNDKEAQVVSELMSIANASQYNQVNEVLKKLTGGKGVFAWIGSFIQGNDLTAKLHKNTSILDQLTRIWYPAIYKEIQAGGPNTVDFSKNPWTFLNFDRSLYQKFQSGNRTGSSEDSSIKKQYTKKN